MKKIIIFTFLVLSVLFCQSQTVKHYTSKDGVKSQPYFDCVEDGTGNLWFAGTKGVSKWDGSKFTFIKCPVVRYGHRLLLDNQKAILIYNNGSKVLSKIQDNGLLEIGKFHDITSDADGNIWGISDQSLFRYKDSQQERICSDDNTTLSEPMKDSKGNIWLSSGRSIYRIKDKGFVRYSEESGLDGRWVKNFFEDSKGRIWVATESKGIFCYSDDKWIVYKWSDGIFSNYVSDIVEDKNGLIWAAHYKGGISYYDGSKWEREKRGSGFFINNPLKEQALFPSVIKIDSLNNIWFACIGGNVLKFNGTDWEKFMHIDVGSVLLGIYIGQSNKNIVWLKSCTYLIYTGIGLNKYDIKKNELTSVSESSIYDIAEGENGVVWFYTNAGLYKYDDKNGYTEVVAGKNIMDYLYYQKRHILLDKTGNIWVGFKDGISCVSPTQK
jgi:ligand-binding sensor domain-containing protein